MNRNPSLLARLFRRSESPLVAQVFAHAIGQPLLVHPQIGEQLVGAYLHGAVEMRPPTLELLEIAPANSDPITGEKPARNIAVLNVSGGLVNRPAEGMCDPGPISYARMRQSFDAALADPTVEAVILRLDSPGGMVAGCFDLADHIASRRGDKPIFAMVDDYAYSAAYAIAAAADEIWVTRTGGVGSIGVIAYHYDQSGWDAKIGLKVTAIFAGAHKNDGTPHAPMPDDVREHLQQRIDGLRLLFAQSVANYRGMALQAVLDTEAETYNGQTAIDAGLADRLGTWHDLVAHVAAGGLPLVRNDDQLERQAPATDEPRQEADGDSISADSGDQKAGVATAVVCAAHRTGMSASAAIAAITDAGAELPTVASAVLASDLPADIAIALQRSDATPANVSERIAAAGMIADLCTASGLRSIAPDYVKSGVSVESVRAQLLGAVASVGPEIETTLRPPMPAAAAHQQATTAQEIYDRRAAAAGRSS